jgi:hypothetical protein
MEAIIHIAYKTPCVRYIRSIDAYTIIANMKIPACVEMQHANTTTHSTQRTLNLLRSELEAQEILPAYKLDHLCWHRYILAVGRHPVAPLRELDGRGVLPPRYSRACHLCEVCVYITTVVSIPRQPLHMDRRFPGGRLSAPL